MVRSGLLSTVQDLGRPGYAHLGVPRSGAVDPDSLRLANRLVGNPESAAAVETTLLGVDVRLEPGDAAGSAAGSAEAGRWLAVAGAPGPVVVIVRTGAGSAADPSSRRVAATDRPVWVPAGATLSVGPASQGLRAYVAVAGGVATTPVLGSRSSDLLSNLGPAPLRNGDRLPLGQPTGDPAPVDVAPRPAIRDAIEPRILPGPRDDWFTAAALPILTGHWYEVSPRSNRIGVRLDGLPLPRQREGELPSEGIPLGALQVPPGGQPIVHLADHPTTGGYPVIAVVHSADLWMLAQARPGTRVRFRLAH